MEYLVQYGYLGLLLSSFLAATILPLSSEIVLTALLLTGLNPVLLLAVATFGNVFGSVTNYLIGRFGGEILVKKLLKTKREELAKAQERFEKYGVYALLLAWVPIIGDPITLAAGLLRTKFPLFLLLVTLGKFTRYALLIFAIDG